MLFVKRIFGVLFNTGFFGLLLFPEARTLHWRRAWIFLGVNLIAASVSVFSASESLLNERYKPAVQKGQPVADSILLLTFILSFCADVVFIPEDVFRLHLLPRPGPGVCALGLALFIASWWLLTYAMLNNPFAAVVVRLQTERGQHVIDAGPYRLIRHTMYAGFAPMVIGLALWLESYPAAIAAIVPLALLIVRAHLEEKFLLRSLPGYAAYVRRVQYRFIPFVW
jgi:protein-S-isoprenylcysteine O-methyltransferase Ste14